MVNQLLIDTEAQASCSAFYALAHEEWLMEMRL